GLIAVRPELPETGDRDENDVALERLERRVAEAHRVHGAGAEILQHDVGFAHQRGEYLLAARAAQIEADRFLAAVIDGEINALAAHHGRMPARFLAADALDLDPLGAEIGQHHAAARPGLETGQLQHAHTVESQWHRELL